MLKTALNYTLQERLINWHLSEILMGTDANQQSRSHFRQAPKNQIISV